MVTTNDKLSSIYQTKLQIKNILLTESDNFSEYPDLITAAIESGGPIIQTAIQISENILNG